MAKIYRFGFTTDQTDDTEDANRQTVSLAGLAMTLFLLAVSLFLVKQLHHKTVIEDCLMSGATNCDLLVAKAR